MSRKPANRPSKKVVADRVVRQAVRKALKEGKVNLILDAKPCSIEIGATASSMLVWKVKIYEEDAKAILSTVPVIKKIKQEITKQFSKP